MLYRSILVFTILLVCIATAMAATTTTTKKPSTTTSKKTTTKPKTTTATTKSTVIPLASAASASVGSASSAVGSGPSVVSSAVASETGSGNLQQSGVPVTTKVYGDTSNSHSLKASGYIFAVTFGLLIAVFCN
ncbi:hypothetical protein VKS41_000609 [Umbelopsis sp. WA50703]